MTYFGFLAVFLCIPIALLWALEAYDARRGVTLPAAWRSWPMWMVIVGQVVVAVVYTTPWDNYLVATRVWWYNPGLVTGFVIGYVPIEEYTFFVLQTLLTAAFLLLIARYRPLWTPVQLNASEWKRKVATGLLAVLWVIFAVILVVGWKPGTYLALLMVWALPPLMIQTGFGADILWHYRRYIVPTVVLMTLYLAVADKLAISSGTWTINPEQSLNIFVFGTLPIEELIFFFMTNVLVAVGITLASSTFSKARVEGYLKLLRGQRKASRSYDTGAR